MLGNMRKVFGKKRLSVFHVCVGVVLLLLLIKYFLPIVRFGSVPLGYDAGIYRYLFVQYEAAFPFVPRLPDWAREHPPGLFLVSTVLMQFGVPVEWFTGWLWNVSIIALGCVLAWISVKRWGQGVGVMTLFAVFLSQAYYDGFAVMYWKTYIALLFTVLAFYFLEKKSLWSVVAIACVLLTHHQTSLLLLLVLGTWTLRWYRREIVVQKAQELYVLAKRRGCMRIEYIAFALLLLGVGAFYYLPVIHEAVFRHVPTVLKLWDAPGGSFPEPLFYVRLTGVLLLFGVIGFVRSFKKEQGNLWQIAVLWSAIFVVFHLMFYRRFYLQLDFFLLPFAGMGMWWAWQTFASVSVRVGLAALLLLQAAITFHAAWEREPYIHQDAFAFVEKLPSILEEGATVFTLDDRSAILLRGWLPFHHVGGPGLFESRWSYQEWETFILGLPEERKELFGSIDDPFYIFISPYALMYYGQQLEHLLKDPCLQPAHEKYLLRSICSAKHS
ncbi:hypothetical protein COU77_00830 [Candidatus Peregrinibacteria bacterium CG10_big_fil_rev_8_21_14_0_10_49_16]|nr:MAG: hypothetical protein COW95_03090 [Candidatus Peregrinibacteria bacterium CG22_combo_CG10-13_8_21_14_all_49_11]PIR52369.1 MAG: hypothetical protein COU77_00830 [Candidatus Peregrinibacteria bacterium CG10_big_fil_rev_8_21_14_0_10_49_16]